LYSTWKACQIVPQLHDRRVTAERLGRVLTKCWNRVFRIAAINVLLRNGSYWECLLLVYLCLGLIGCTLPTLKKTRCKGVPSGLFSNGFLSGPFKGSLFLARSNVAVSSFQRHHFSGSFQCVAAKLVQTVCLLSSFQMHFVPHPLLDITFLNTSNDFSAKLVSMVFLQDLFKWFSSKPFSRSSLLCSFQMHFVHILC